MKWKEVFLGSCTNGRLEDLEVAARILKNKKVRNNVKFIVTPASKKIFKEAIKLGYIKTLVEAGAMVTHPYCSLCQGRSGGLVSDNEVVLSTNNRNFLGRMGSSKSLIYLSSPAVAAASAIYGKITNPSKLLN
jgi:3-isopropylmalate/(R)-2-methylmalate dehydratase large subunit